MLKFFLSGPFPCVFFKKLHRHLIPHILPLPKAYDIVVAADGSGNFTTIQAAVNSTNSVNATIYIKKGIYQEKLVIPTEKSGSEQRFF